MHVTLHRTYSLRVADCYDEMVSSVDVSDRRTNARTGHAESPTALRRGSPQMSLTRSRRCGIIGSSFRALGNSGRIAPRSAQGSLAPWIPVYSHVGSSRP